MDDNAYGSESVLRIALDFQEFRHCATLHSGFCFYGTFCNSRKGAKRNDGSFGPKQFLIRSNGARDDTVVSDTLLEERQDYFCFNNLSRNSNDFTALIRWGPLNHSISKRSGIPSCA